MCVIKIIYKLINFRAHSHNKNETLFFQKMFLRFAFELEPSKINKFIFYNN